MKQRQTETLVIDSYNCTVFFQTHIRPASGLVCIMLTVTGGLVRFVCQMSQCHKEKLK